MILDEPTANFDPDFRKEFLQILSEFVSDGENSYMLINGLDYKMNLIDREQIIYKEKGKYAIKALVKYRRRYLEKEGLTVEVPSIEDIMYYIMKGKEKVW